MCDKWLVWRLSAMGDALLATGALFRLHSLYGARFHMVTREAHVPAFAGNPAVELVFSPPEKSLAMPRFAFWAKELAAKYAGWGFLDLHGTFRSCLLGRFWRGPVARYPKEAFARRVFLASRGKLGMVPGIAAWGESCRKRLLAASVAQRYALALEETAPPASEMLPRLFLSSAEKEAAAARLSAIFGEGNAPPVALHPYATHSLKAWPVFHWRELAAMLDAAYIPWIILGHGESVFPGRKEDLSRRTSLRESAALLSQCRVLVTGDSGPMHLAASVGTRVAALFGPTVREWGFYPTEPDNRVLEKKIACRPCSLHGDSLCPHGGACMRSISPHEVFSALGHFQHETALAAERNTAARYALSPLAPGEALHSEAAIGTASSHSKEKLS